MAANIWTVDGKTQDSGSVRSAPTSLDDDSDDFGRMLLQHARDEHRLNRALGPQPQAFRKARLTDFEATLDRAIAPGSYSSGESDPGAAEHTWTNDSDPPLNIPRGWGRKSRLSHGWMSRLRGSEDLEARPASAGVPFDGKHLDLVATGHYTSRVEDRDDLVLSAQGGTRAVADNRRAISSPTASRHVTDTIGKIQAWEEEQDFTAGSILQSTPALISRTTMSGRRASDQEGRLDRLSRISELETSKSAAEQLEARLKRTAASGVTRSLKHSPYDQKWGGARALGHDKENVPIRGGEKIPGAASDEELQKQAVSQQSLAANARHDSIQLLKRLARATNQQTHTSTEETPENKHDQKRTRQSSAQGPDVVVDSPSAHVNMYTRTPKVMGAWIETPMPIRHDSVEPMQKGADDSKGEKKHISEEQSRTAEPAATSALQNLLHPTLNPTEPLLALGDETLASLQGILDPTLTLDLSATVDLTEIKAELDALHAQTRPLTKTEEERRDELLAIDGMSAKLRAARRGVKEVGKGLRDVEKRVDSLGTASATGDGSGTKASAGRCDVCARGVWRCAADEALDAVLPRRGATNPRAGHRGAALLGTALAVAAAWWVVENTLCAMYCHPRLATRMHGFGIAPDAPRYPLVLPTLLFRPLRWLWRPLCAALAWAVSTVSAAVGAYVSILLEDDGPRAASATAARTGVAAPVRTGVWRGGEARPNARFASAGMGRDGGEDVMVGMGQDSLADEAERGGFAAKLWNWRAGPGESGAAAAAATAATTVIVTASVPVEYEYRAHEEDEVVVGEAVWRDADVWREADVWELGDGMHVDEAL